jgi:hypothetical protein
MNNRWLAVGVVCATGVLAGSAEAQVSRVFVAVEGNDANVCSNVATPCRTIAGGITQVDAEGEVIIIASGSYAGGTISKPVKVSAAAGVVAFSGLPIVVNPGAGKLVAIRGMTIKAATPGSGVGITLNSGRLSVEGCVIDGWFKAILVNASAEGLHVVDGMIRGITNYGIDVAAGAHSHTAVEDTRFFRIGQAAYRGYGSSKAAFSGCEISDSNGGIWNYDTSSVLLDDCRISKVNYGLYTEGYMLVSRTSVTDGGIGAESNLAGVLESSGNNLFRWNGMNTKGTITPVPLQ